MPLTRSTKQFLTCKTGHEGYFNQLLNSNIIKFTRVFRILWESLPPSPPPACIISRQFEVKKKVEGAMCRYYKKCPTPPPFPLPYVPIL